MAKAKMRDVMAFAGAGIWLALTVLLGALSIGGCSGGSGLVGPTGTGQRTSSGPVVGLAQCREGATCAPFAIEDRSFAGARGGNGVVVGAAHEREASASPDFVGPTEPGSDPDPGIWWTFGL